MVALLGTNRNYLVLGVINGPTYCITNPAGLTQYSNILAINASYASTYSNHYVDIRAILKAAANTDSSADLAAVANDCVPPSLQFDTPHLNAAGYAMVSATIDRYFQTNLPMGDKPITYRDLLTIFKYPPNIGAKAGLQLYIPGNSEFGGSISFGGYTYFLNPLYASTFISSPAFKPRVDGAPLVFFNYTNNIIGVISNNGAMMIPNSITASNGVVYSQLAAIPTNSVPTGAPSVTNWLLCNLNGVPTFIATNYNEGGWLLKPL